MLGFSGTAEALTHFVTSPILRGMRRIPPSGVTRCPVAVVLSWVAATCILVSPPVTAEPADNNDAVTRLLIERGLLGVETSTPARTSPTTSPPSSGLGLVQQVRDRASDLVLTAMNFLGVPYRLGGSNTDTGFDCSGFTRFIFERSLGLVLPRRADEQASAAGLLPIKREELKPGDLVFFNTLRRTFSHVGIYVGEGKFIHSPRPGGEVRVEDMRFAYWSARFTGARRAELPGAPGLGTDSPANRAATLQR